LNLSTIQQPRCIFLSLLCACSWFPIILCIIMISFYRRGARSVSVTGRCIKLLESKLLDTHHAGRGHLFHSTRECSYTRGAAAVAFEIVFLPEKSQNTTRGHTSDRSIAITFFFAFMPKRYCSCIYARCFCYKIPVIERQKVSGTWENKYDLMLWIQIM